MSEPLVHVPKFKQVEAQLRHLVNGLPIGTKLPPERELADRFGCNFLTVRRAIAPLVDEGAIGRRVGSGSFVLRHDPIPLPAAKRIGVLVYGAGTAYAYAVLQAAAHAGSRSGLELRSAWVRDFAGAALAQVRRLQAQGCRALILPWFPHDRTDEVRDFVRQCPLPVSLSLIIPGLEQNCFEDARVFGSHAIAAMEGLCDYFFKLGAQPVAFLGPDMPGDAILQKKLSAYACHTSRRGWPNLCGLVGPETAAMEDLAAAWCRAYPRLSVISYDDEHALRFMTAMHKRGRRAPEDYQIIGFNDGEASRYSDPPLSTIAQNFDYIGEWLLRSAWALAEGTVAQSTRTPPARLLVRSTCGGAGRLDEALRAALPTLDLLRDTTVSPDEPMLVPSAPLSPTFALSPASPPWAPPGSR